MNSISEPRPKIHTPPLPLFQWAAERHHHRPVARLTRWTVNRWLGVEAVEVNHG